MLSFAIGIILAFIVYMIVKLARNASPYQTYYWKQAWRQIGVSVEMIWHGVIRNKGHHSLWKK
jgi:hypothetical protein